MEQPRRVARDLPVCIAGLRLRHRLHGRLGVEREIDRVCGYAGFAHGRGHSGIHVGDHQRVLGQRLRHVVDRSAKRQFARHVRGRELEEQEVGPDPALGEKPRDFR